MFLYRILQNSSSGITTGFSKIFVYVPAPQELSSRTICVDDEEPTQPATHIDCIRHSTQGVGSGDLQGGLCEERPGAVLCWTQMVPAGSNRPPAGHSWAPQPTWWRLRESVCKKGQNATQAVTSEGKSTRNSPADTEVREGGGRGGAPGASTEIPLQPVGRTMVEQVFHCSLWTGPHQCRQIFPEGTIACGEPMLEQI